MGKNVLGDIDRAAMESAARARGYRNYDDMIYSMRNRLPPPKIPGSGSQAAPSGGGFMNFLQVLFSDPRKALSDAFAWHPANTIGRASSALQQAREGRR